MDGVNVELKQSRGAAEAARSGMAAQHILVFIVLSVRVYTSLAPRLCACLSCSAELGMRSRIL